MAIDSSNSENNPHSSISKNEFKIISKQNNQAFDLDLKTSPYSSLYDLFAEKCLKHPKSKYIWYLDEWFTYNQVKIFVDRCSLALERLKIPPKTQIAIQLPNSLEFIIFLLACNKLHLPVVLIKPTYKATEIYHILKRSKVEVYFGLNSKYQKDFPKCPKLSSLKLTILTNLGELRIKRKISSEYRRIAKFFHLSSSQHIPNECISFSSFFEVNFIKEIDKWNKELDFSHLELNNIDHSKNSIKDTAIIIESYDKKGMEQLNAFSHQAILAQIFQLEYYFMKNQKSGKEHLDKHKSAKKNKFQGNKNIDLDFTYRFLGFIGIQPFSSSFGSIGNIYLPMVFESYTIVFPDAPKTKELFEVLHRNIVHNGLIFIGSDIIFQRIYYYRNIEIHRPFMRKYFKHSIVCHHPVTKTFQNLFQENLGIRLLNSYGSLEIPFIAIQNPKAYPYDTDYSINKKLKKKKEMQLLSHTSVGINDKNEFFIKGPQQVTSINNRRLKQKWISPEDSIEIDESNFLNIQENNSFIVTNCGYKIVPSHVENLYMYYKDIKHASIETEQFPIHKPKKNITEKSKFVEKTVNKRKSFEVLLDVNNPLEFSKKDFFSWCHDTIISYKCPEKIKISKNRREFIQEDENINLNQKINGKHTKSLLQIVMAQKIVIIKEKIENLLPKKHSHRKFSHK